MSPIDFGSALAVAQLRPAVMLEIVIVQRRLITGATCLAVTFVQRVCVVAALRAVELFIAHGDLQCLGLGGTGDEHGVGNCVCSTSGMGLNTIKAEEARSAGG